MRYYLESKSFEVEFFSMWHLNKSATFTHVSETEILGKILREVFSQLLFKGKMLVFGSRKFHISNKFCNKMANTPDLHD